jgi:hypothetical protein
MNAWCEMARGALADFNSDIARRFTAAAQNNTIALAVLALVLVTMMIDVSLARVYDLINKQPTSFTRIIIFILLTSVCIGGQMFLLEFAAKKSKQARSVAKLRIHTIHNAIRLSQFAIAAILAFLIFQIVITDRYYSALLISVLWINSGSSIFVLALLAKRFLTWFAMNRNYVILMYALASASIAINVGFTAVYVSDIVMDRGTEIGPYSAGSMVLIPRNSITAIYSSGFFVSSILAFGLLWLSTAMLLHNKAARIGKLRFWLTISSPLVLFLAQFVSYFGRVFDPLFGSDPATLSLWITLIFTLSKPLGGVLFGVAFYSIARKFGSDVVVKNYLIISAVGFVLLFSANQASVLLVAPYPPFGIAAVSLTGIASYFIVLGIYSSAISISRDTSLRVVVRKNTEDGTGILDTIGTANMRQEIERKVVRMVKENSEKIMEATGLDSMESDDTVRRYVDKVVEELRARNSQKSQLSKADSRNED